MSPPPVAAAEEHAETSADAAVAEPAPEGRESFPAAPHHLELTYVFEVDAVEMPGTESQVVPEDEPAISISASTAENYDDEVLPFEVRRAARSDSGFRIPDSGVQGAKSESAETGGQPTPQQPKLFKGSDE